MRYMYAMRMNHSLRLVVTTKPLEGFLGFCFVCIFSSVHY